MAGTTPKGERAEKRPPMAGVAVEDVAEAVVLGDLLHLGAGVGDGDEMAARLLGAHGLLHLIEEVLLEDIGLEGGAGFAGDDDERIGEIDLVAGRPDLLGVGGVDDAEGREIRAAGQR